MKKPLLLSSTIVLACGLVAGQAVAALVNIAPFGTATIVGGAFAGGNIINPQGGNDGNSGTVFHTDNATANRGVTVTRWKGMA